MKTVILRFGLLHFRRYDLYGFRRFLKLFQLKLKLLYFCLQSLNGCDIILLVHIRTARFHRTQFGDFRLKTGYHVLQYPGLLLQLLELRGNRTGTFLPVLAHTADIRRNLVKGFLRQVLYQEFYFYGLHFI